jgi:hypothetical protein
MKVYVNMIEKTVRSFNPRKQAWEECSFYESGILQESEDDEDVIEEHLLDRHEDSEIIFI